VRSIAAWGADDVKVDFCRVRLAPPRPLYRSIRRALDPTGRPIVLSICDWGLGAFAAPGAFDDPDALLAGTRFLRPLEQRAQLSLWSVLAAPLRGGEPDLSARPAQRRVAARIRVGRLGQTANHVGPAR